MGTRTATILAGLLVVMGMPVCTPAAIVHVPDDQPTIQAGIVAAQVGDTVLIAAGTYFEHDIELKSGINLLGDGRGSATVVIDAMRQGRVMRAYNPAYEPMHASIRGITFRNGFAGSGAGIHCSGFDPGFDLDVIACAFESNEAQYGGGMFVSASTVVLRDCSFSNNKAGSGAGLACETSYAMGRVDLIDCGFADNRAQDQGGGICSSFYALKAIGCTFRSNHATRGGGMYSLTYLGYEFLLSDCTFENNAAVRGGALYSSDDDLFVTSCLFKENVAELGGAVFVMYPLGPATVEGSTFAGNTALRGSGICLNEFGILRVENCILAAGRGGSALHCEENRFLDFDTACCDVHGNEGGNWVDCIADQADSEGNISQDPQFCLNLNPNQPYTLQADSPCAESNNPACGRIGAFPVGCGATAAAASSISAIKVLY